MSDQHPRLWWRTLSDESLIRAKREYISKGVALDVADDITDELDRRMHARRKYGREHAPREFDPVEVDR